MISPSLNLSMKMKLYLTLVRSQLMYCTPIWHPYLQKDIQNIERIQCRATKFILNDYDSNYKTRLLTLKLLPLMYLLELQDIIFTFKSLKYPTKGFNILHHIRLIQYIQYTFIIQSLIYIYLSPPSKSNSTSLLDHFVSNFNNEDPCTFHILCPCNIIIIIINCFSVLQNS